MYLFSYTDSGDHTIPYAVGKTKTALFEYARKFFSRDYDFMRSGFSSNELKLKARYCSQGDWAIEDPNGEIWGYITGFIKEVR